VTFHVATAPPPAGHSKFNDYALANNARELPPGTLSVLPLYHDHAPANPSSEICLL
jgi:hypothetical protein